MRHTLLRFAVSCLLFTAAAVLAHAPAQAAIGDPYDTPTLECVAGAAGENTVDLKVTAGASGAPAGVSIQWMKKDDYDLYGWNNDYMCAASLSGQPSYSGNVSYTRWELGPYGSFTLRIGAYLFDETGASATGCALDDLECGTEYIFRVFAHATNEHKRSAFSTGTVCATKDCPAEECTHTQGFWKTHGPGACQNGNNANEWPVQSLTLGNFTYNATELCTIMNTSAGGPGGDDAALKMGHQLIAAIFNVMIGATCESAVANIQAANALLATKNVNLRIRVPKRPDSESYTALNGLLDAFNNGLSADCPAHCTNDPALRTGVLQFSPTTTSKTSWGSLKQIHR